MVSNEGRNNIISLAVIAGFSILIVAFIFTFVGNMEKATNTVTVQVSSIGNKVERGIINITDANDNLTRAVANLANIFLEEREVNKENLATFVQLQNNNTAQMVDTINQMSRDNNVTRNNQTNFFVAAIEKQLNATSTSQNLTKERIAIETETNAKLDNLTQFLLQIPLTPNITHSQVQQPQLRQS
jgi:hypothetical protein